MLSSRHGEPVAGHSRGGVCGSTRPAPVRRPRTAPRNQRRVRDLDNDGIIPVLARAVREVEAAAQRGRVRPAGRTKFQVVALLVREERTRVKADGPAARPSAAEQLKRLDGIATILAKTAARDTSLLALLAEDAVISGAAASLKRDMLLAAGVEPAGRGGDRPPRPWPLPPPSAGSCRSPSSPDSWPTPSSRPTSPRPAGQRPAGPPGQLGAARPAVPLVRVRRGLVVHGPARAVLPGAPGGMELMHHQAQLIPAAASGHRTFLLADEPGLGKTAQALLAAQAANAYPLLVVVPNVVKANWARRPVSGLRVIRHRHPRQR